MRAVQAVASELDRSVSLLAEACPLPPVAALLHEPNVESGWARNTRLHTVRSVVASRP